MGDIDMCNEMSVALTLAVCDRFAKAAKEPRKIEYSFGFEVKSLLTFYDMWMVCGEVLKREEFSEVLRRQLESSVLPEGGFRYKISSTIRIKSFALKSSDNPKAPKIHFFDP